MSVFDTRVRGFRVVEIGALSVLLVLVVGLYLSKTGAGRERSDINLAERQIAEERGRIRLLTAEVAHLEAPGRLSALAEQHLGLGPVAVGREITAEELPAAAIGALPPSTLRPAGVAQPLPPAPPIAPGGVTPPNVRTPPAEAAEAETPPAGVSPEQRR